MCNVYTTLKSYVNFQYMLKSLQQPYEEKTMNVCTYVLSSLQVRFVEASQTLNIPACGYKGGTMGLPSHEVKN